MPTPTETEFARLVWSKALSDNVFGRAAELAYFFLFSLFPLLIVLTSLLGTVSGGAEIRGELLRYLRTALPPTASRLVESTLAEISAAGGGGKLSLGILGAFASAGAGMVAIIEGLNTAYNVREARPWLKRRAVALVLTLALSLFSLAALGIFLYGTQLGNFLANHAGVGAQFKSVWYILQWPLAAMCVFAALSLTYRFAPNVRVQQWRWIFPGAVVASVLWLAASAGLRLYLRFFDTYTAVYGSLGAVMILMIWFYLFGVAILIGGEVNCVLENAAAQSGEPDAKLTGEKTPLGDQIVGLTD
ncbi:MAG: YihY/virulence factor BrkB family protein [Candidatus Solibacter sp.]